MHSTTIACAPPFAARRTKGSCSKMFAGRFLRYSRSLPSGKILRACDPVVLA